MKELPKAYEPGQYEDNIYKKWEDSGLFNPDICVQKGVTREDAETFSMVLPPPNVTGTLHMGHAVMLAIQDVMARYHRMKGDKTVWIPGTDHAAVATESKVEKMLIEGGMKKPKEELGREEFLKKVEAFAQESHDTIVNQAKKMGASLDWSREAYTLDEARSKAVKAVFKKMHDDGLIYRGYRVVNWSVKGQSTCSDDELVYVDRPGKLYTFYYNQECPIPIATTRPETKLGDTAIAVHPEGKWKKYIGKEFVVEHFGQEGHTITLKVIADESVDDDYGTGALGVTPAHSMVDFEMYSKQKAAGTDIGLIQVIGEDGCMTAEAGSEYKGVSVQAARAQVVEWLRTQKLLEAEEDTMQNVGTSDRFGDVVEPLPKTQWFIDVNKTFVLEKSQIDGIKDGQEVTLKELMQHVVREKQIQIVPERFEKTYFHWIDNLRDWNISRQIWYGHRIPVWYCLMCEDEKNNVTVEHNIDIAGSVSDNIILSVHAKPIEIGDRPEACFQCGCNDHNKIVQDADTLDTWFSSGLWTFSTLGWPDQTTDLKQFHPTSVLETGYDILFFWVARMILMTTYTLGTVPFETVYLHGLVRDEQGRKMSKSLGNIINPLDMSEKYGTDAVRLSLMVGGAPGNDMKLSEEKIAGYRNFANKLWNISRFMLMNIDEPKKDIEFPKPKTISDKWFLNATNVKAYLMSDMLEKYQFSSAAEALRAFTWDDLADWYLEIVKIEGDKSEILNYILNTILKLWHPFMPFVTEAIWQEVYGNSMLMIEKWPELSDPIPDKVDARLEFPLLKNVVTSIRSLRAEKNIEPAKEVAVTICTDDVKFFTENEAVIKGLARVGELTITSNERTKAENIASAAVGGVTIHLDLAGAIDVEAEKKRLQKEIDHVAPYVASMKKKLANKGFTDNAPEAVLAQEQKKLEEAAHTLAALQDQLSSL